MVTIGHLAADTTAPAFGAGQWYNAAPRSIAELARNGRPALLDFWTATSPYARRSLHRTRMLWEHYAPLGLEVIGIHTPEFTFDTHPGALAPTLDELGVRWPNLHDYSGQTWQAYDGRYWPRMIFIAPDGTVASDMRHDAEFPQLVDAIHGTLDGQRIAPEEVLRQSHQHRLGTLCYPETPPIALGMHSLHAAATRGRADHAGVFLEGSWAGGPEYVSSTPGSIALTVTVAGLEHTAVLAPLTSELHELTVEINGAPVPTAALGDDLVRKGQATVVVLDRPRLYQLIRTNRYPGAIRLTLRPNGAQVAVYRLASNGCPR